MLYNTGQILSPGTPVSSTNKSDCHDITDILSKVALNNITLTPTPQILFKLHQIMAYTFQKWTVKAFISF